MLQTYWPIIDRKLSAFFRKNMGFALPTHCSIMMLGIKASQSHILLSNFELLLLLWSIYIPIVCTYLHTWGLIFLCTCQFHHKIIISSSFFIGFLLTSILYRERKCLTTGGEKKKLNALKTVLFNINKNKIILTKKKQTDTQNSNKAAYMNKRQRQFMWKKIKVERPRRGERICKSKGRVIFHWKLAAIGLKISACCVCIAIESANQEKKDSFLKTGVVFSLLESWENEHFLE